MPVNYDIIAKRYDFLSRLVFQQAQVKAQVCLLAYVPANSNVLIVGGGTGWILEELAKQYSSGLVIYYVELSAQMIALAQKRKYGDNTINFINTPIENYDLEKEYDIIITPFLFDNFLFDKAELVFNKLDELLKTNGKWLQVDFVNDRTKNNLWQMFLLKAMYVFFNIVCHIEASELIDMDVFFQKKFNAIYIKWHYNKFIKSIVYERR